MGFALAKLRFLPFTQLDRIRYICCVRLGIVCDDHDHLGVENFLYFVPDKVVDRLHLQFGGQCSADAVDDHELVGTLPGFVEQPVGLVK